MVAYVFIFVASFVCRFFEYRVCIVFGSFVNGCLDRAFGDNLIFAVVSFEQKKKKSLVPKLHGCFNDVPSMLGEC